MSTNAQPILVFDAETTGTDVETARAIQVACLTTREGRVEESWGSRINPEMPIPAEASAIHGIRDADVAGAPTFSQVLPELRARVEPVRILVGYNARTFDVPLTARLFRDHGAEFPPVRVLDVIDFVRWHFRHFRVRKLKEMCEQLGLPPFEAHDALADVQATRLLLRELVRRGLVPMDPFAACDESDRLFPILQEEGRRFSYYLYVRKGVLRVGFGKHCGRSVAEVPASYWDWVLGEVRVKKWEVPPEALAIFETLRAGNRPQFVPPAGCE